MIEFHGNELVKKYSKEGCTMLELGNQIMNLAECQGMPAKIYYSRLGYKHTSADINGRDGALELDLCEPQELGKFEFITDFGTTEHVNDLFACLKNVFNACENGGIMLHKNPKTGNFPKHGNHYFTVDFWKEYAYAANLEVIEIYEHPIYHNTKDGWGVIAILRKLYESKFPTKAKINKLKELVHAE